MKNTLSSMVTRWKIWQSTPSRISPGRRTLLKSLAVIALSFCSYFFFSRVVVTAVEVKGASMSPTLTAGDRFILNRFAYLTREPQRGEMVVLKDPETGDLIVKRIIGLPAETVVMKNYTVFVNGKQMNEPYATGGVRHDTSPFGTATVIPPGYYFVLGDNRARSLDSRVFGPISRESIVGVISL